MKKHLLSSIALLIVATSSANAAWVTEATATGTATVNGLTNWSISQKTAGVFEQNGNSTTPMTMTISNAATGSSGRFAISTTSMDSSNWFIMTKKDNPSVTIRIKPVDESVVKWDSAHSNYVSVAPLDKGNQVDVPFMPYVTNLTPGSYEITLNLQTETV